MAATRNATTVFYGTAWSDHTAAASSASGYLELEERTGMRQHLSMTGGMWRQ